MMADLFTDLEALLAVFLLICLMLAVSSRLFHCVYLVAAQGILLGLIPLLSVSREHWVEPVVLAAVNFGIKGAALPRLLIAASRKAEVRRELEPLIGYSFSLLIVLGLIGLSFWIGTRLPAATQQMRVVAPAALAVMLTGLFMVMARRKAITQVIGFLTFENGISLFGTGMMLECGLVVELGILLDVFVLAFIMGIVILRINREFDHIDADRLNQLGDAAGRGVRE